MAWPKGKPRKGHVKKEVPIQIDEPDHKDIVRIVDHWYPYSKGARSRFLRQDGRYVDRQWSDTGTSSTWWLMPAGEKERTDADN